VLAQARALPIRVFVVWEPILPTDWMRPSGMMQSRIADPRVAQFWDKGHLVAKELRRELVSEPNGYNPRGTLWDFLALYGKQAKWGETPPVFTGGPVVMTAPELQKRLTVRSAGNLGH
jgi:hypothetical protein